MAHSESCLHDNNLLLSEPSSKQRDKSHRCCDLQSM